MIRDVVKVSENKQSCPQGRGGRGDERRFGRFQFLPWWALPCNVNIVACLNPFTFRETDGVS